MRRAVLGGHAGRSPPSISVGLTQLHSDSELVATWRATRVIHTEALTVPFGDGEWTCW